MRPTLRFGGIRERSRMWRTLGFRHDDLSAALCGGRHRLDRGDCGRSRSDAGCSRSTSAPVRGALVSLLRLWQQRSELPPESVLDLLRGRREFRDRAPHPLEERGEPVAFGVGVAWTATPIGGEYPKPLPIRLRAFSIGRCERHGPLAYRRLQERAVWRPGGQLHPWQDVRVYCPLLGR